MSFSENLKPQAGSVKLINSLNPKGYTFPVTDPTDMAFDIGNYNPQSNTYLEFKADTPFMDELKCGANTELVEARIQPKGHPITHLSAAVHLFRSCPFASPSHR